MRTIRAISWITGVAMLLAAASAAETVPAPPLQVTYLANEGFLVEGAGKRVLVDALFGEGISGYPALAAPVRQALERGEGEWAGVTVALASHHHGDHFDPAAVERFLRANPRAVFVSTPQAVAKLEAIAGKDAFGERVRAVLPPPGKVHDLEIDGVTIRAMNLHHGPLEPPVENLGVIIELGDARLLHFGDTEAEMDDFRPYLDALGEVDVALLPFWFLASEWRIELVRESLRPRCIAVAHVPEPSASAAHFARWESYANLLRVIRTAFPQAHIPTASAAPEPVACPAVGS